ncbi:MAG: hypothetical protein HFI70_01715 [Lachnospiraceae bacterium]|nr:hypothetical protein [Lachnospiraceae bacterium]
MARIEYSRQIQNIAGAVSIDEYERSLTRISREIEEEDYKRRALMRNGKRRSMLEELEDVNMLGSILSPYELVRK